MSRSRRKLYSLGLGALDMTLLDVERKRLQPTLPLAEYLPGAGAPASADWGPAISAVLAQAHKTQDSGDLMLTVSDAWARYWMLSVPEGIGSLEELRALARARFEALFGTPADGWTLMAEWRTRGQVLVCALPERLLAACETLGEEGVWRVVSVQPHAIRLMNSHRARIPDDAWVCCFGAQGMLALLLQGGAVQYVRRFRYQRVPEADELMDMLDGEILRAGTDTPMKLCALGILPEVAHGTRIRDMKLVLPQGDDMQAFRPGMSAESVMLARVRGGLA
ncbi:MAG: hypothetical protein CGU28_14550 [Candidatus Dactylopiibacterium carminicum]|uniref:Uncharacterized protein n=1 Tax=Candidatus Dactylopiibacterium carminicum TaxID=857335 RepID=A0A272ER67_9RHOO|nr:hypothetical protein [Candidatus Dactylopiibacterium carminicum]KAF7598753.1 hypothetical protein BGI27_11485 [Candidatus Dactylopiibacterium carminicum]PAS92591.1 MAG: hypothetical protein CGU29_10915 [Candidatus Dactylopiibacterium carminicum]PAS93891.1 MAG: hypothetical protein CGU28_14550 [Candidatus Dactylopiibacterium carminicum]PAS98774.1 MAG: hypothetical protein BSR46_11500 [Candidatus Dactylopiibacterium carminicum]